MQCVSDNIQNNGLHPATRAASLLSDVLSATPGDAGATGFVLSHLARKDARILWVQDRMSQHEAGRPYLPGLAGRELIEVHPERPADVLWALEEGLRCKVLGAAIGEIWGDPPALDFTATKRLALRAEASGVPCWLIRRAASPGLSAARDRWKVASLPSAPDPLDPRAPGNPRWQVELFRARQGRPGAWVATYDRAADRVDFSAPFRDGTVAEAGRAHGLRAAR